jgi:catechol 2,3-dioxygenase-like lactoylglutathione lyase family enzyme
MPLIIDHVQLPVPDTALAADWYVTHLGFTTLTQRDWLAELKLDGGPHLFLFRTGDKTTATFTVDGQPYPTIGAQTSNIAALHEKLVAASTQIVQYTNEDYGILMKFFDPFGNMWAVYEPNEVQPSATG